MQPARPVRSRDPLNEILLSLWKIHILHHAADGEVVGQWMLSELHEHGYRVSPGTMYPLLRRMEHCGWLRGTAHGSSPKARRAYVLTVAGRKALARVRAHLGELMEELA